MCPKSLSISLIQSFRSVKLKLKPNGEVKLTFLQGKPILMLCNKADIDEARDEVHIVNTLQVERLVNEARFNEFK